MERGETDQDNEPPKSESGPGHRNQRGRTWTIRNGPGLRFRHFVDFVVGGRRAIVFAFEPSGEKLDPRVYDLLVSLKELNGLPTDLKFLRDSRLGKVWVLPNTPQGRTTAEKLSNKLLDLGAVMDEEQGRNR